MIRTVIVFLVLITVSVGSWGQHHSMTFQEAKRSGISIEHLDSIYKSAIHTDTSLAVFKTDEEQEALQTAYIQLLQDLGTFLYKHDFKWEQQRRCFNRIYFSADGTIDYFLFNFTGPAERKPSEAKQEEFNRLVNLFIQDYQFPLKANTRFAQCSPTTYQPVK